MTNTFRAHREHAQLTQESEIETSQRDVPDVITVVEGHITFNGEIFGRGDCIRLDSRAIASTIDRAGDSWLFHLSEAAQVRRHGRLMVVPGDHSAEIREADQEALEASEAQRQADRDRDGRSLLEQIWREEQGLASRPKVMRSVTTSTARSVMP